MNRFENLSRVARAHRFAGLSILALMATASLVACSGPVGPMSGGRLTGTEAPFPDDWKMLKEMDVIQLETHPDDPYSVNVWVVAFEGNAYISTSLLAGVDDPDARRWVQYVKEDPRVRVGIDDYVFPARVSLMTGDSVDPQRIFRAFIAKYPQIDTEKPPGALYFRIDRR